MSDEIMQEVQASLAALQAEETTPEVQEEPAQKTREDDARAQGWRPEEEFEGDKAKWVPAEEFLRRKPLFDKIHDQGRELKDLRKAVEHLVDSSKKIEAKVQREEQEKYEAKLAELQQKRREAIEMADADEVERFDKRIEKVKESRPEEEKPQPAAAEYPHKEDIEKWVARNPWFDADADLREFMELKQNQNLKRGMSVPDALKESEKQVRAAFAHKFENPNKEKPSPVSPRNTDPKRVSIDALPAEMRTLFKTINRATGMSLEDYIADQKKAGHL